MSEGRAARRGEDILKKKIPLFLKHHTFVLFYLILNFFFHVCDKLKDELFL